MNLVGSPIGLSPIKGQGTGFRWQSARKSEAYFDGRMTRFAWMWPGARPDVEGLYDKPFVRQSWRTSRPQWFCAMLKVMPSLNPSKVYLVGG